MGVVSVYLDRPLCELLYEPEQHTVLLSTMQQPVLTASCLFLKIPRIIIIYFLFSSASCPSVPFWIRS